MKRIACSFLFLFAMMGGAMAQSDAVYVYRNNGSGNLYFLKSEVDSILCSQKDMEGNPQEQYVVQEIWRQDSVYRTPLTAVDSVIFVTLTNYCPDTHHPHAVDLGLPSSTKWACCNVGAAFPEAYGGYYSWGETSEKGEYSRYTYAHTDDWIDQVLIGSDIAGTDYDAARACWGEAWRMPSVEQQEELMNHCATEWVRRNGVDGVLLTGSNGNQLFLPAAGYRNYDELQNGGAYGYYWSSGLNADYGYKSYYLTFGGDFWRTSESYCFNGHSVRAVCK